MAEHGIGRFTRFMGGRKKDLALTFLFSALALLLYLIPTEFEDRLPRNALRCKGEVLETDDSGIQRIGMVVKGHQELKLKILDGPLAAQVFDASNTLMGRLDIDKLFIPGDIALVVVTRNTAGEILYVNPQDHYRIGWELLLLSLFVFLLLIFGGWTGAKALVSFLFTALCIWKVIVPLFLKGYDPVLLTLFVVAGLSGVIIFLVAGLNRKGLVAFLGAFLGVITSSALALFFTPKLHVHGAVLPFAETLLYSGFGHLDLVRIYMASVFLAASGAVMDLAMDVAVSMDEVVSKRPDIGRLEAMRSGFTVGRAVVGTMTTTLLLAYSGGYITLLMAFMAQGIPLANLFNLIYVAAEVLKTLVGSFGLVAVAPFTAVVGAFIFTRKTEKRSDPSNPKSSEGNL